VERFGAGGVKGDRPEEGAGVSVVQRWTGRETRLLRHALRLTVRDFAEDLGAWVRAATSGGAVVPALPGP
jgi:hypothetical protein